MGGIWFAAPERKIYASSELLFRVSTKIGLLPYNAYIVASLLPALKDSDTPVSANMIQVFLLANGPL